MLIKIVASITGISAIMLIVMLLTTNPSDTGPLGILGFFVFMYLSVLGALTFSFRFVGMVASKLIPMRDGAWKIREISFRRAYYYASVVALIPVMFIAFQSVGEVGVYQVLLIAFFAIISWIYVSNRTT